MTAGKAFGALTLLVVLVTPCGARAQAQDGQTAVDVQEIVVEGMRDPSVIHYVDMSGALEAFNATAPGPRVHMVLKIVPNRRGVDASRIRVILRGRDGYVRDLLTFPGGRVDVPLDPEALKAKADFVFFARPGEIRTEINVLVDTQQSPVSYRALMSDMKAANAGERVLMSPIQRLEFAPANALALQFLDEGQVEVRTSSRGTITLHPNGKKKVIIPLDPVLYDENPTVVISGNAPFAMVTTVRNPQLRPQ